MLESAEVYFLDTLDELLGDIVNSDDELKLLLDDPGGTLWKKPEYEKRQVHLELSIQFPKAFEVNRLHGGHPTDAMITMI